MEAMVEKVEKNKREEITHQENSQEEKRHESGSSSKYGKFDFVMLVYQCITDVPKVCWYWYGLSCHPRGEHG